MCIWNRNQEQLVKHKFRLIIDEPLKGSLNMGIDNAITEFVSKKNSAPTLRLYSWISPVVTVGYFQKISETVNTGYCIDNNIDIIRRVTGGGTVLHNKEITYSFITPINNRVVPEEIEASFRGIIDPIIAALKESGIDASFKPVNDINVNGKKISGSAQTRKHGVILQHGTIILDIDKSMFTGCLKFDSEKLAQKGVSDPLELLTSVSRELGSNYNNESINLLKQSIADYYSRILNMEFKEDVLSHDERILAAKYEEELFTNLSWNLKRL